MALRKEEGANLRKWYHVFVEAGLTLSLVILVVAFQTDYRPDEQFDVQIQEQEVVEMEEIQQTKQEQKPPPPPKPPVPVEVPNNETVDNEDVDFDASLDLDESLNTNQGPPAPEEEEEEDEIFVVVEQNPDCGGVKALQDEVEYPNFAKKAGIEGRVFVKFVVNEKGNVVNPKVTRGVHKLLNKEALRAVKKLDCKPGQQRGQKVKVEMSLPVTFKLQ